MSGRATGNTIRGSAEHADPADWPDRPGVRPLWGLFGLPPVTLRDTVEDEVPVTPARLALLLGLPAGLAAFRGPTAESGPRSVD